MVAGSFALWTVIPIAGLWLAARIAGSSSHLSAAPALVVLVGIPAAVALGAKALARLEREFLRMTGTDPSRRIPAWRRSLSDSSPRSPAGMLDKIMVASVLVAALTFITWFVLLAGPPVLSA
jgi:hypothetical protein